MNFNSIRIVLVATSHPGNIGSSARALKTMGFKRLYLVTPKSFPDIKAIEMAAGADDILADCQITSSLQEAVKDCHLVFATSARTRGLALPELTPSQCAAQAVLQSDAHQIAIVFGREHAGLTNEELMQCHFHVIIPANPHYSSLNLSQAVQIIAYELRMALLDNPSVHSLQEPLASVEEIEQWYEHLFEVMLDIGFFKPNNPGKLQERIRRLFNRSGLEKMEVNILRGFLTTLQKALLEKK